MAKAIRDFHLLPAAATADDTHGETFHCGVGGHPHLTFEEVYGTQISRGEAERQIRRLGAGFRGRGGLLEAGEIAWLCFPSVLKLTKRPEKRPQPVPEVMAEGVSAHHGQYVAGELARTTAYAARHYSVANEHGVIIERGRPLEVPGGPLGEPAEGRLALAWPHLFVHQVSTRKRF